MGTKIEHAIDPLILATSSTKNSNLNSFALQYYLVNDWNSLRAATTTSTSTSRSRLTTKFLKTDPINNNFSDYSISMDRHSLDSIKKTMQIQEDIFKRQVQELHRLYSVQKRLMGELNRESKNQLINNTARNWNSSSSSSQININNSRNIIINHATSASTAAAAATTTQQTNTGGGYILHFQNAIDHQDAIRERSGSCSGENIMKMGRGGGFDLERPAVLSAAAAANSDDEEQEQEQENNAVGPSNKMSIDDEEEVELTLSTGVSSTNNNKKKKSKSYQLGRIAIDSSAAAAAANAIKSDHHHHGGGEDCSSPMSSSSTSATFDQDKKMPHWLFGLSINRT